jgi:hypothetical protein
MRTRLLLLLGALSIMAAMTAGSSAQRASGVLAVAGRANAHVSLAALDDFVVAAWSVSLPGGVADVYSAISRDGGVNFATPVRVNRAAGDARVNGEQPPRVAVAARTGGPEIAVIWTTKADGGTRMVSARSIDAGRTFSPTVLVPGTDAPGNRGWEALGEGPQGRFFAVWLDHRQLAAPESAKTSEAHSHNHSTPPVASGNAIAEADAMAAKSQLYIASLDGVVKPQGLTGGVCYCCKTAMATSGDTLFLAWRHVFPGSVRDIAFTASRDGGRTFSRPVRVSEDQWQINGCPDDGPSMSVDGNRRVHLVWPTVIPERGGPVKALFYASSSDGATFTPRQRIPTEGQANHPQLVAGRDGGVIVTWDETGSGARRIVVARGRRRADGATSFARATPNGVATGTYPAVASTRTGAVMAYTSGEPASSVIATARIP